MFSIHTCSYLQSCNTKPGCTIFSYSQVLYTTYNPPLIYFVMSYRSTFIVPYHSFTHRKIYLYTHSLKFTALHLHTSDTDPPLSHFTKNFGTILCYLMLRRLKCLSPTGRPRRENVIALFLLTLQLVCRLAKFSYDEIIFDQSSSNSSNLIRTFSP